MRTIKSLTHGRPSLAIKGMVEGLKEAKKNRPNFKVSMYDFGWVARGEDGQMNLCRGCAATCAIQYICGHWLSPKDIGNAQSRAKALGLSKRDLMLAQEALDAFRAGTNSSYSIFASDLFDNLNMHYSGSGPFGLLEKYYGLEMGVLELKLQEQDFHEIWGLETKNWESQLPIISKVSAILAEAGM